MRACAAKVQIDLGRLETVGQFETTLRLQIGFHRVQTKRLAALGAGKVRVPPVYRRGLPLGIHHESPHPIIARDAMRNADLDQPIEHPIHRHPIDRLMRGDGRRHILMRDGMICGKQRCQYCHAWLREPFAGSADVRFGFGDAGMVGWFHGACM